MRNLKRALSLTLASVMLLGMMVVGTSALSFNDADDISNVTAASVLEELGVMVGDGQGNFMPDKPVTRAQMAIIICRIMYGNRLNVESLASEGRFTDVAPGEYYTGYVNFAAEQGIISGYGDGRFGPDDTVTTAQAALMLCRGLGYYQNGEDKGDWGTVSLNAISLATKLKMFGDLKLGTNDLLVRDNVAEMTFNTMTKAVPVMYNATWNLYYTDSKNVLGGTSFNYMNSWAYQNYNLVYRDTTDDAGNKVIIWGTGTANGYNDATDTLVNPVIAKPNEIIIVEQNNSLVYTVDKKAADVEKDLKGYTVRTTLDGNGATVSNAELIVNGKKAANLNTSLSEAAKQIAAQTDKGYTVKVYTDRDGRIFSVSVIKEELAKVTAVNASKKEITLQTASQGNVVIKEDHIAYDKLAGQVSVGDYVLAVCNSTDKVFDAYVGKSVTGVVTSWDKDATLTVDGTPYKKSACGAVTDVNKLKAPADYKNSKDECTLYLDSNDRVIRVFTEVKVTGEDICFVTNIVANGNFSSSYNAYVYLPDGTKGEYKVASYNGSSKATDIYNGLNNKTGLYAYTLDGDDISLKQVTSAQLTSEYGNYKLTAGQSVAMAKDKTKYEIGSSSQVVYMNADTRFYMVDGTKVANDYVAAGEAAVSDLVKTSKGISSVGTNTITYNTNNSRMEVAYRTVNGNNIAIAVYVLVDAPVAAVSEDLVFVTGKKWTSSDNDEKKFSVDAIFTGNETSEMLPVKTTDGKVPAMGLYTYSKDGDDYKLTPAVAGSCAWAGTLKNIDGQTLEVANTSLKLKDNTIVLDLLDDDVRVSNADYLTTANFSGYAVTNSDKDVLAVYFVEKGISYSNGSTPAKSDFQPGDSDQTLTPSQINTLLGKSDTAPGRNIVIAFENSGSAAKNFTLSIKKNDIEVYTETANSVSVGQHFFYINLDGGGGTAGSGTYNKQAFTNGTYKWTIEVSAGDVDNVSGSFTVVDSAS